MLDLRVDKETASGEAAGVRLARLIRHRPVALLLAADRIAAIIEGRHAKPVLDEHYPRELVLEVSRRIKGNAAAIRHLGEWFKGHPGGVRLSP